MKGLLPLKQGMLMTSDRGTFSAEQLPGCITMVIM